MARKYKIRNKLENVPFYNAEIKNINNNKKKKKKKKKKKSVISVISVIIILSLKI